MTCVRVVVEVGRCEDGRDSITVTCSGSCTGSASGVEEMDVASFEKTVEGRSKALITSSTRQMKMPDSNSRMGLFESGAPVEGFGGFMAFI